MLGNPGERGRFPYRTRLPVDRGPRDGDAFISRSVSSPAYRVRAERTARDCYRSRRENSRPEERRLRRVAVIVVVIATVVITRRRFREVVEYA